MKQRIKIFFYSLCKLLPIKTNRILLFSYYGENYGGSPKYLSKYFIENTDGLDVVWAFTHPQKYSNLTKKIVKFSSFKYYYYLATAKFIITNYRMTTEFEKRNEQKYIQTWHSSLRLKNIEKDAEDSLSEHYVNMAKKDSKQIDLLLTGSRKGKEIFENCFWYDGNILECGTPQCDLFFTDYSKYTDKVYRYFNIQKDKKIVLYAPTFRKNYSLEPYNIDYNRLINTLKNKFENEFVVLVRLHPHLVNLIDNIEFSENVINATSYDDVQELLCVSDVLITDYSALMFDYSLTKKPCFLYATDLENYISKDRKLYFNLNELPFTIAKDNDQLNQNIDSFNLLQYQKNLELFLNLKIGIVENGSACKQVLKYIESEMK